MFNRVVIITNVETEEFFFSTNHSQPISNPDFVPCTYYLPFKIVPREGFESGVIKTAEDLERFKIHCGGKLIENPNRKYRVEGKN